MYITSNPLPIRWWISALVPSPNYFYFQRKEEELTFHFIQGQINPIKLNDYIYIFNVLTPETGCTHVWISGFTPRVLNISLTVSCINVSLNILYELLVWVSYIALKLYAMSKNYSTGMAILGLIVCFEAVWHPRELQHRNF